MKVKNILLTGDEAFALGAVDAGISMATGYPGSPSSGVMEALIALSKSHSFYIEWSANEKVALEMAIGCSIAGRRALVCVKSVGLNAMLDPMMTLNLTPVHGGLVILLGDDPGGYGSQNDQDTRLIAPLIEMPLLEPSNADEAYRWMYHAFGISEQSGLPVILRETRSFSVSRHAVTWRASSTKVANKGINRERLRFVPVPKNVVSKHSELHQRLTWFSKFALPVHTDSIHGKGKKGIVAAGFTYQKLLDIIGNKIPENLAIYKMGLLYPPDENSLASFLKRCNEALVLEENEPFVENTLKTIAYDHKLTCMIYGKKDGYTNREGELYRWRIQQALKKFLPDYTPVRSFLKENEKQEIPPKENFCKDCGYDNIMDIIQTASDRCRINPVIIGDPGCLVTVADRIDAKYAMGSSVAVADGICKSGYRDKVIALFGDSSFFHTSLPAICNAVYNRSNMLMIVLDNKATATSGFQPNPGTGRDIYGKKITGLSIERIATSIGVPEVHSEGINDGGKKLNNLICRLMKKNELALIVVMIKNTVSGG